MKRIVVVLILIILSFGANGHSGRTNADGCHHNRKTGEYHCHSPRTKTETQKIQSFSGKVISVLDGDTIEVLYQGRAQRVRLAEIDCPEKNQPFGKKAKQFTSTLVFGKNVTVKNKGLDKYGRIIGEMVLLDGTNVSHELVRAGLAWQYKRYSNDLKLLKLETDARKAKRGLWIDKNAVPPWEFRHPASSKTK